MRILLVLLTVVLSLAAPSAQAARSEVGGSIDLAPGYSPGSYGDEVAFTTSVTGKVSPKSRVYVQVIGTQGDKVVYQWSADPGFVFPLVQQDGLAALGIFFEPNVPTEFVATLVYRESIGNNTVINALDSVTFSI